MPVYNESEIIETVVRDYLHVLDSFNEGEFVIVNDASKDTTFSLLQKCAAQDSRLKVLDNEKNMGHGPTLMRAYHAATKEYVFHVDSDNQFVAEDFWLLWKKMESENLDVVIGRRHNRKDPFARLLITFCLKNFLFLAFGVRLIDPNSPFRLFKKSALEHLLIYVPKTQMLPSICLSVAAYKKGYKVGWVNVTHLARMSGHSFIRHFKIFRLVFAATSELLVFKELLAQK